MGRASAAPLKPAPHYPELQNLPDRGFDHRQFCLPDERLHQFALPVVQKERRQSPAPFRVHRIDELVVIFRAPQIGSASNAALLQKLDGRGLMLWLVGGYRHQAKALVLQAALQPGEQRHLLAAGSAPSRPEIHQQHSPCIGFENRPIAGLVDRRQLLLRAYRGGEQRQDCATRLQDVLRARLMVQPNALVSGEATSPPASTASIASRSEFCCTRAWFWASSMRPW